MVHHTSQTLHHTPYAIQVLSLIEENTAAALHYAIDRTFEQPSNVLYYNMGAGSTQVSIHTHTSYTCAYPYLYTYPYPCPRLASSHTPRHKLRRGARTRVWDSLRFWARHGMTL
ncbi:hypothetical protein EON63_04795 [archaeon]|nr:MAG: hypothetical protein EON63_04795 [archaeon]